MFNHRFILNRIITSFVATAISLAIAGLVSGCTRDQMSKAMNDVEQLREGIFSNRPQKIQQQIVIIKLQNPALLSSVKIENGKKVIDPDLQKAVDTEQDNVIAKIKNEISSSITVLYRYKMVLNALAIVTPPEFLDKLRAIGSVAYIEGEGQFGRPVILDESRVSASGIKEYNSVNFIGADKVHQMILKNASGEVHVTGLGVRVGIIDTGIDYTHSMMKGPGTEAAYLSVDPAKTNSLFPNEKVVGGIDLVGTLYNAASAKIEAHIPTPDANPIDEAGHGSHVAGTVAGTGDGIQTYDGVAPDAKLYAVKVFGAEGSTGDAVVIAGLEYAADITSKGNPNEQLDVVNLSLGSSYGFPHILYNEAVTNLTRGGTVVVASAGNSGPSDYIVGAPSVADDAISVAASIDHSEQNWKFPAAKFLTPTQGEIIVEAIEAPIGKAIEEAGDVTGPLVLAGIADADFNEELVAKVKGKVAFIDRGKVTFAEKISRAQKAGAIGVVVGNNQPGEPFKMGGTGPQLNIPAIMISQALASILKEGMKKGDVIVKFKNPEKIEKPEFIDTLTSFSSKGPRSFDGMIKPEISSPGENVISAEMGKGNKSVQMSGTSMAAPHITGVMALLKQIHPDLSVQELKSILMGQAKSISTKDKEEYPVSMQGAGRVQSYESAMADLVSAPAAISLGEMNLAKVKVVAAHLNLKNLAKQSFSYSFEFRSHAKGISLLPVQSVQIASGESLDVELRFKLDASVTKESVQELDGFLTVKSSASSIVVPVLAVMKKVSAVKAEEVHVASSEEDAAGAVADLKVKNSGANNGDVMIFNLLGMDTRKANPEHDLNRNMSCDLQAAGYRIIEKATDEGKKQFLQVAVKLFEAQTTWNMCEISVLLDVNGDGVPEQELAGVALSNIAGLSGPSNGGSFMSVLLDATVARAIRGKFEADSQGNAVAAAEDYAPSVLRISDMKALQHSTVAVIEAPVEGLAQTVTGEISVRVATIIADDTNQQSDDFLDQKADQWVKISLQEKSQGFFGMPEKLTLNPGEERQVGLSKGFGKQQLMLLYPQNSNVYSDLEKDGQVQILKPLFGVSL